MAEFVLMEIRKEANMWRIHASDHAAPIDRVVSQAGAVSCVRIIHAMLQQGNGHLGRRISSFIIQAGGEAFEKCLNAAAQEGFDVVQSGYETNTWFAVMRGPYREPTSLPPNQREILTRHLKA